MWYKCLNPNCGFVFPATEECEKCPDCGKQCLQEATDDERKPSLDSLDEKIKNANKRRDAQDISLNSSNTDGGNLPDKGTPGYKYTQQESEIG